LRDWSSRKYQDEFHNGRTQEKKFGLSRATTLAHFISGGLLPISDSRARRGMIRLTGCRIPRSVLGYLDIYCPLFRELASICETQDLRAVDKALFVLGKRNRQYDCACAASSPKRFAPHCIVNFRE
jgi:hypothetical protein